MLDLEASDPRQVLDRLRRTSIEQSVDDMRSLYAAAAVYEFPFRWQRVPARLEGREQIVDFIAAGWQTSSPRYTSYRTVVIHDTGNPDTIVGEQEAVGTGADGTSIALPNIVVLTVHNGQISVIRDYVKRHGGSRSHRTRRDDLSTHRE
jgi:ketosteroid isomerase-like protein